MIIILLACGKWKIIIRGLFQVDLLMEPIKLKISTKMVNIRQIWIEKF